LLVWLLMLLASLPPSANMMRSSCGVVHTARWDSVAFATLDAAVEALGRAHLTRSVTSDREFVGGVLRDAAGRFWGTVGAGCPGQDTVTFVVAVPVGSSLAAFWHTHGAAGLFRELFSPEDVQLVRNTGHAFYLMTPGGELRVLEPGDVAAPAGRHLRRSKLPSGALAGRVLEAAPGVAASVAGCGDSSTT
jgi:Domain of unknown function (DUF4329)